MKTKTPKRRMNVALLRKIQRQILKEPKQFDMDYWYDYGSDVPNCGTTACIAGWAVALDRRISPRQAWDLPMSTSEEARRLLRLNWLVAERLFFENNWPLKFKNNKASPGTSAAALNACKRIDHFIKTGK